METIQTLVRNLAIILLLATFLEFLLPNKSLRGFVQLVMGIFVISAVLNPIAQLLNFTLEMNIPAWASTAETDIPALAQDDQGAAIGNSAVQDQYKQILINQVKALALAVKDVKDAAVKVEFEEKAGNTAVQPEIHKVEITIATSSSKISIEKIEPVVIGDKGEKKEEEANRVSAKAMEVREKIIQFMELSPEKVEVVEKT